MSQPKRRRRRKAQPKTPAEATPDAPEQAPPEPEPTAPVYGLWLVPGQGWQWVRVRVPVSLLMDAAEEQGERVTAPNVLSVALPQAQDRMQRDAVGLPQ